jgi:hypothetical protein
MNSEYLYTSTVPAFIKGLQNLLAIIAKAKKNAKQRGFNPDAFATQKLAPDMLTFAGQIQYMYFITLDAGENLAGKTPPKFTYQEKTMKECEESIRRTLSYLRKIKPTHFEGAEMKRVPLFWDKTKTIPAERYVKRLVLPTFYFHMVTAYGILRHNGVPIGMEDYIGTL